MRSRRSAAGAGGESLKERAYEQLRALVLSDELPVGAITSERQLVARMEMSKTPIRVALERLERDGLIEILPQRGVRVRALTDKEVADHFDLRIALETWVAARLAHLLSDAVRQRLHAALDEQRDALDADDLDRFRLADADFHDLLAQLTGNDEIVRTMRVQRERLSRIVHRILEREPRRAQESLAEHAAIVAALEARDDEQAAARMREHLRWGRRFLVGTDEGPPAPSLPLV